MVVHATRLWSLNVRNSGLNFCFTCSVDSIKLSLQYYVPDVPVDVEIQVKRIHC